MHYLVSVYLFIIILFFPYAGLASPQSGFAYLATKQAANGSIGSSSLTAWAVMAYSMAGMSDQAAINHLVSLQTSLSTASATDIERQILGLAAAGEDPRSTSGVDAVALLNAKQGAIERSADLNDDMFAILAYQAVGITSPAVLVQAVVRAQNDDGGWGMVSGGSSSSDMTAIALMVTRAALPSSAREKAVTYLRGLQNNDGGFATQTGESNTASTAWVCWMLTTLGEESSGWQKQGKSPWDYLRGTQSANGSWSNSVLVTSYSLMALTRKPLPYRTMVSRPTPSPTPKATPNPTPLPSFSPTPTAAPSPRVGATVTPAFAPTPSPTMRAKPATTSRSTPTAIASPVLGVSSPTPFLEATETPSVVTISPTPLLPGADSPRRDMSLEFGGGVLALHTLGTLVHVARAERRLYRRKTARQTPEVYG